MRCRSFAKIQHQKKKEAVHFLCILKAQTPYLEQLKKLNFPSVKGGYKFFLDVLDEVNKFNASRAQTSVQITVDFIKVESIDNESVSIEGIEDLRLD